MKITVKELYRYLMNHNMKFIDKAIKLRRHKGIIEYERQIRIFSSVDSIAKPEELWSLVENSDFALNQFAPYAYNEGTMYGHAKLLYKYAGVKFKSYIYTPEVEHGAKFYNFLYQGDGNSAIRIAQGKCRNALCKEKGKTVINFAVGPLILYADPYYDTKKTAELKKSMGRIVLFVPAHTTNTHNDDCLGDESYQHFLRICKDYDTGLVCLYYRDLGSDFAKKCINDGIKIVCAGMRLDPFFLSRLRTIYELSEEIVFDEVTTGIGYAYALGKKVTIAMEPQHLFVRKQTNEFEVEKCKFLHEIIDAFNTNTEKEYIEKYWGTSCFRTREEIRDILRICEEITKLARYDNARIRLVVERYRNKQEKLGNKQIVRLLDEAVNS